MVARGNGRRFAPKKKIESFAIFIQLKKKEMISFFFRSDSRCFGFDFRFDWENNFGNEKKKIGEWKRKKKFFFLPFF